jgi:Flp pilus assembly protein TadG
VIRPHGRSRATTFLRNESGAVAMIFGLALIPLAGMMGLALDYSRVSLGRAELQAAVDSAGLAAAQLPRDTPLTTIQQKAQEWVEANTAGKGLGDVTVTATKNGTNLTFKAESTVAMTLFSLLRKEAVPLSASNEVTWDLGKVEIALVLDNTGSMAVDSKLTNLKTAATKLVDVLQAAITKPGQVKIGVVPFSMTVKIGSEYRNESWIAQHQKSPINSEIFWNVTSKTNSSPNRFALLDAMEIGWGGCVENRPQPYDIQDTPPSTVAGSEKTLFVPFFAPDEPDTADSKGKKYYANSYQNDLYATSQPITDWQKLQGDDRKYTKANRTPKTTGLGPNLGCDMTGILRLTTDLSVGGALRNKINAMQATGETNIPMGLIWGWHLISPHLPFADGVPYDAENVTKYIILMTDGENTYGEASNSNNQNNSDYTGLGFIWQKRLANTSTNPSTSTRSTLMNGRLQALCANLRKKPPAGTPKSSAAPDIQVYTIGVGVNSTTRSYLQQCATTRDMYYDVTNSSDMSTVFTRIADEISQLRLSK